MRFPNRVEAGRQLARRLEHLRGQDLVVLGLPRGGVPVALQVAEALDAPLDIIVVRKLGVPAQPELGMGAIGEDGVRVINEEIVTMTGVTATELASVETHERAELERRARRFRGDRPRVGLVGRVVVVVDDGIATGSTARAACQVARAHGARRVVLAVPVAPPGWTVGMGHDADELVALETPDQFFGVGQFYANFAQTTDDEVVACLEHAGARRLLSAEPPAPSRDESSGCDEEVTVEAGPMHLAGRLTLTGQPAGIVIFAHGSGSSRLSPRNRFVAEVLQTAGLGTLLFDLLTREEEGKRANVFDVDLLSRRLLDATAWLRAQRETRDLPIGYFGASTGAAAALSAAAEPEAHIAAVVSSGGRPDLAGARLSAVTAPTLLIVGGDDALVVDLNREAQARLNCENRLTVVPGATHLFEEPGALERVASLAREWFVGHFSSNSRVVTRVR